MNPIVGTFLKAQLLLVSTLELTLRLGRVVIVRFVQSLGALGAGASEASDLATAASAVSVLSGAVLESRAIVQNDWLDLMRFGLPDFWLRVCVGTDCAQPVFTDARHHRWDPHRRHSAGDRVSRGKLCL
jgi:hypothetical protein